MKDQPPTDGRQLVLTVGLPRAGKTTWALQQDAPIVSPDAIRLAVHGHRFWAQGEQMVWAVAWTMARALFAAGHRKVIVDATHNTRKRRDFWSHPAGEAFPGEACGGYYRVGLVVFSTDAMTCMHRAYDCEQPELCEVIERMAAEHEPPGEDEDVLEVVPGRWVKP